MPKRDDAMEIDTISKTAVDQFDKSPIKKSIEKSDALSPYLKTLFILHDQIATLQLRGSLDPRFVNRLIRTLFTSARPNLTIGLLTNLIKTHDSSLQALIDQLKKSYTQADEDVKISEDAYTKLTQKRVEDAERKRKADEERQRGRSAKKSSDQNESQEESKEKKAEEEKKKIKSIDQVPTTAQLPETNLFLQLAVLIFAIDRKQLSFAVDHVDKLFKYVMELNRRTTDTLSARIIHAFALVHEMNNTTETIRDTLLKSYRTSILNHNYAGQAALTNAILRNYIQSHLYELADTFRSKISFPSDHFVSSADQARYEYYCGRLDTVMLHYSDAESHLQAALRKAPSQGDKATDFRITVTRLLILVQLLMGEIPERSLFINENTRLQNALFPYLQLTRSVRIGELERFTSVIHEYNSVFTAAQHNSLIQRLRQNVIKTGLRNFNITYTQLSLQQIAQKLKLDENSDIESIVVKAISDGVIEGRISKSTDNKVGPILISEIASLFLHNSVQESFHKRISFANSIYTDAVKSLRFAANSHKSIAEHGNDEESDEEEAFKQRILKKKQEKEEQDRKNKKK